MAIFEKEHFHRIKSAVERRRAMESIKDREIAQTNPEVVRNNSHIPDFFEARVTDFTVTSKQFVPIETELNKIEEEDGK
jgi:hypothetical protein